MMTNWKRMKRRYAKRRAIERRMVQEALPEETTSNESLMEELQKKPVDDIPIHLGGGMRKCNADKGALRFAVNQWGVKSVLDIGCGRACFTKDAIEIYHMDALGIDGVDDASYDAFDFKRDVPFLCHDYVEGSAPLGDRQFDLCWTAEFLEHVDKKYIPNFMVDIQRCKNVICTAAKPGDGGHHHVNEQSGDYWVKVFDQYGFDFDEKLTIALKKASTMKKKFNGKPSFIQRNGLVFIRRIRL